MKSKAFDKSKYANWIDPNEVTPYERNAKIHTEQRSMVCVGGYVPNGQRTAGMEQLGMADRRFLAGGNDEQEQVKKLHSAEIGDCGTEKRAAGNRAGRGRAENGGVGKKAEAHDHKA